jgi:hypothetical protein
MALTKVDFMFSQRGMTRKSILEKVVLKFMEEKPGPAEDENYNRYEYHVEKIKQGEVVLTRPANLKLGFDFRIDVPSMKFLRNTVSPSHEDMFQDLKLKHSKDPDFAEQVRKAIIRVYNMEEPADVLKTINDKNIGLSVELLLKVSKWFAIEQDVRYWNGWGRNKHILWLDLMRFFAYDFKIAKKAGVPSFIFYHDKKELTEKKAIEIMNSSGRQPQL